MNWMGKWLFSIFESKISFIEKSNESEINQLNGTYPEETLIMTR